MTRTAKVKEKEQQPPPAEVLAEIEFGGKVSLQSFLGHERKFACLSMTYARLVLVSKVVEWNAITKQGEQRALRLAHARKLLGEMTSGAYTPASISLAVTKENIGALQFIEGTDQFKISINRENGLSLVDGQHRVAALTTIANDYRDRVAKAPPGKEKERLEAQLLSLLNTELPVVVLLDGDSAKDFLALNTRLNPDKAHILSLRVQKMLEDPQLLWAFEAAKLLDSPKTRESPFMGMIRFDSHTQAVSATLPLPTLMAKGSDVATSLLGGSKIAHAFGVDKKPSLYTDLLCAAYQHLARSAPELYEQGKVLTPPSYKGTKGSSTMLVMLGNMVLYRLAALNSTAHKGGIKKFDDAERDWLTECAMATLDVHVEKSFSSQTKRALVNVFLQSYMSDLGEDEGDLHEGIPRGLITLLGASALGASPIPGEKRGRGRPSKASLAAAASAKSLEGAAQEG